MCEHQLAMRNALNKRTLFTILAALPVAFAAAQLPHPRIWLDSPLLTKLRAKAAANDPTWLALKAQDDTYLTGQVFWPDVQQYGDEGDIGEGYQGSGWIDPITNLALGYQVLITTDPTTAKKYAAKLMDVLNKMTAPSGAHFVDPIRNDGYAIRFYTAGEAIAYDMIYPELTPALKTRVITSMNKWVSIVEADGFGIVNDSPANNYYSGFYMAKALAAIATEGDNTQAPAMWNSWLNTNHLGGVQPYFSKWLAGGGWPEGFDYGPLAIFNMIAPVWAAKTGKGIDLFNNPNAPYAFAHDSGQALMEMIFPNQVTMDTHGETYDTEDLPVPTADPEVYTKMAGILQIFGDAGARQLHKLARAVRQNNGDAPLWVDFLFWDEKAPELPLTGRALSYLAKGPNMSIMRSDWSTSAVWGNILGGANTSYNGGGHEKFDKGGLTITRGGTRFLIQAHAEMDQNSSPGAGDGGAFDFPPEDDPDSLNNFFNDDFADNGNASTYNVFYTKNPLRWGQFRNDPTFAKTAVSKFEEGGSYTYTRVSHLEDMYNDGINTNYVPHWTRDVLYLRPELFVVRDRTIVHDQTIPQYMAWHFGQTPVLTKQSDNGLVDNRYDVSDSTGLYKGAITSLFPAGGGTNLVNLFGSGLAYRVEASTAPHPTTGQSWLSVLDPALNQASSYTSTRMSAADGNILQGGLFGAEMVNATDSQIALFGTGSDQTIVSGPVVFVASKIGEGVTIADMTPGTLYTLTSSTTLGGKILVTLTPGSGPLKVTARGILAAKVQ